MNEKNVLHLAANFRVKETALFKVAYEAVREKRVPIDNSNMTRLISIMSRHSHKLTSRIFHIHNIFSFQSRLPTLAKEGTYWTDEEKILAYITRPGLIDARFFTDFYRGVYKNVADEVAVVVQKMCELLQENESKGLKLLSLLREEIDDKLCLMVFICMYYSTLCSFCLYSFKPRCDISHRFPLIICLCAYLLFNYPKTIKSSSLKVCHYSLLICTANRKNKNLWVSDFQSITYIKLDSYIKDNIRKELFHQHAVSESIYNLVLMITALRRDCISDCWPVISAHGLQYLTRLKSHKVWSDCQ